nr:MAG TPA: hypothetical protein [Caudoviricetes sp.]
MRYWITCFTVNDIHDRICNSNHIKLKPFRVLCPLLPRAIFTKITHKNNYIHFYSNKE